MKRGVLFIGGLSLAFTQCLCCDVIDDLLGPRPTPTIEVTETVEPPPPRDTSHSEDLIDGEEGGSLEPVICGESTGQVVVGPGAYAGVETITMQCLSENEVEEIEAAFERDPARTAGGRTVLGAIELGPDGLPYGDRLFGGEGVTVTVPFVERYSGSSGDIVSLFVYLPDSEDFEEIAEAEVLSSLWAARGDVAHFTTIVAVGPAPGGVSAAVEPAEEPAPGPPVVSVASDLVPSSSPSIGTYDLQTGFSPDPLAVDAVGGGMVSVGSAFPSSGCEGYAAPAPDVALDWQGPGVLRVFFVPHVDDDDSTLVIYDPNGDWHCNDDSFGTLHPTVDIDDAQTGQYAIWVGSYDADASIEGTLYVTELDYSPADLP